MMKKLLVTLQVLACCSLAAQEDIDTQELAAAKSPKKATSDSCSKKKECPKDPCFCFQRGDEPIEGMPMTCKYPAAYNHPANTKVEGCGWDVYGDVSYIYWYVGEDGMDLATTANNFADAETSSSAKNGFTVFQDANYTSGFKVGLGANLNVDDWVVDLEYTYLRNTTNTSSTAPATTVGAPTNTGVFKFNNWFTNSYFGYGQVGPSLSSKWKFGLDWLDLTFKRPFYQGRRLVVTPSAGLRASWIRQTLTINAPNSFPGYDGTPFNNLSYNNSNSWAIGPRGLIDAHWLVGMGFRVQGNMGASLLYTRFTKVSHSETGSILDAVFQPVGFSTKDYGCLRPMAEANLGFGWGSYFYQNQYHWDVSATYDFNYLWGHNMMRYLVDINSTFSSGSVQDLYLHGLTLKTCFDF